MRMGSPGQLDESRKSVSLAVDPRQMSRFVTGVAVQVGAFPPRHPLASDNAQAWHPPVVSAYQSIRDPRGVAWRTSTERCTSGLPRLLWTILQTES